MYDPGGGCWARVWHKIDKAPNILPENRYGSGVEHNAIAEGIVVSRCLHPHIANRPSSLTDVRKAGGAVRAHWGIENKLHWSLDVLFREDDWLTREKQVANLATTRKLALIFIRKAAVPGTEKLSGTLRMWACALNPLLLNKFLFDFCAFPS